MIMPDKCVELDLKDRKILYELSLNARLPLSVIAKKVGLSKQVVKYRLNSLEKRGVICGYYAILDVTKFGFLYHRAFFKYSRILEKDENDILEFGRSHPNVGWIAILDGDWDLALNFLVSDVVDFERVLGDIGARYGEYFQSRYVSIATKIHHLKYKFFLNKNADDDLVLGGKPVSLRLDDVDYKLIDILSRNARMPTVDIAIRLGCTSSVVKYRIRKLVDMGVILGFNYRLDHKLLGYTHHKVNLNFSNTDPRRVRQLVNYLRADVRVIYITEVVGSVDLEFETLTRTYEDLHELMRDVRFRFSDILRDFSTFIMYHEEFSYLPMFKKM